MAAFNKKNIGRLLLLIPNGTIIVFPICIEAEKAHNSNLLWVTVKLYGKINERNFQIFNFAMQEDEVFLI
jgi:hypothetical protein